jgi:error-prone DNA polymerase
MGWGNPPMPWRELERRLSGKFPPPGENQPPQAAPRLAFGTEPERPGSTRRAPYRPRPDLGRTPGRDVPYAELHAHTNFSFLDGAAHPEEMVEEAVRLGLTALAITDHDGFYGVVRFAEAATRYGLPTVFGSELSLGLTRPQNGIADPEGSHLLVLARDPDGYARLSTAISDGHAAGAEKGRPVHDLDSLGAAAQGHWVILTGCRKGTVPAALAVGGAAGAAAATRELDRLVDLFGRDNVVVELTDHGQPEDAARIEVLAGLARRFDLATVATANAHYATPDGHRLATALSAVRARRSLDDLAGWLPAAGTAHLRSGAEQARHFRRYPDAVRQAAELAEQCAFDLALIRPRLPDFPVPAGHTAMSWLRELTERGAAVRYGSRYAERQPGAYAQLDHELEMIEKLDFPGYFLIVHEIVEFARSRDILCQGRGSAANSAVCYALGITAVDAVYYGLLFERFLSPERGEPPDIDVDIESGRREEVIQHVYARYGRRHAAQVANVISYRPRSAVRDMAKALGYSTGAQDAFAREAHRYDLPRTAEQSAVEEVPAEVLTLSNRLLGFPRHLGIHSGGMVICDRPVVEVCPVEWARMADRTVVQWDKDDCASPLVNLVKFDLLGLGMLSALHGCFDLVRDFHGTGWTLATLPKEDPAVYEMLCRADSVGVFQVESRAQMATLPRLKPQCFYDLVLEIALIRPGPIQGGSVHPFIRRRNGREPIRYPHPSLEDCLRRTLGVPMFQEQLMQMVVDAAGCTPTQADRVRRAVGSKRSAQQVAALREELYAGMERTHGITGATADEIFNLIAAFANFGFAESHSISFALLVYASSWLKLRYPAAFCAALLNAQPMGFYSPQSLCADARRHGVVVRRPDVNASAATASLEPVDEHDSEPSTSWGRAAVRLGIGSVRSVGTELAERIAAGRPYTDMADFALRTAAGAAHIEALATAGAFDCFGVSRRAALWAAGAVAQLSPDRLAGTVVGDRAPILPRLMAAERSMADLWATGITPDGHPMEHMRADLDPDVVTVGDLAGRRDRDRVRVAGVVTHRQQPQTASGTIFLNLEDETGMLNVICAPGAWARYRRIARDSPALIVRGRLEKADGVTSLVAEAFVELRMFVGRSSRDFR